jgi:hypothetical protein
MKIACMQPYFLPYIGYWQLINAVDKFVILDDVQYITKGWINRNKICINGNDRWITIPLEGANRNKLINELKICSPNNWAPKLKRTIEYSFKNAPNFDEGYQFFNTIINCKTNDLTTCLVKSIKLICDFLGIDTTIILSSDISPEDSFKGKDRIIHICKKLNASFYYNPQGGIKLYKKEDFIKEKIELDFIKTNSKKSFLYSFLETMMIYSRNEIQDELKNFNLI